MSSAIPTEFGLLSGLTTGGVGAAIVASLIILYRICAKRRCKTHSGCMDFEISEPLPTPREAPPPSPVITPARTPIPSNHMTIPVFESAKNDNKKTECITNEHSAASLA